MIVTKYQSGEREIYNQRIRSTQHSSDCLDQIMLAYRLGYLNGLTLYGTFFPDGHAATTCPWLTCLI